MDIKWEDLGLESFVIMDFETTGLNPCTDSIIEFALARYEKGVLREKFSSLCKPDSEIPEEITKITGITNNMVKNKPNFRKFVKDIIDFIGYQPIIGHNISFDLRFFKAQLDRMNIKIDFSDFLIIDTLLLSRTFLFYLPGFSLSSICSSLDIKGFEFHRAVDDVTATGEIFSRIIPSVLSFEEDVLKVLYYILEDTSDPHKYFFKKIIDYRIRNSFMINQNHRECDWIAPENIIENDDNNCQLSSLQNVYSYFKKDSQIKALIEGFEERDEQISMVNDIVDALENEKFAIIEAGTGVGKSLAYLLPTLIWSGLNKNEKVVIACNTKALQGQLFYKDMPILLKDIKLPGRAVLLKGRGNYICLTRWNRVLDNLQRYLGSYNRTGILPIVTWLSKTKTGDISENSGFLNSDGYSNVWKEICSMPGYCTTSVCSKYNGCFLGKIRRKLNDSNLIIVNHSLLLSDTGMGKKIIPDYSVLVIDEAHNLVKNTYDSLTVEISLNEIRSLLDRIYNARKEKHGILDEIEILSKRVILSDEYVRIEKYFDNAKDMIDKLKPLFFQLFAEMIAVVRRKIDDFEKFLSYGDKKRYKSFVDVFGNHIKEKIDSLILASRNLYETLNKIYETLNSTLFKFGIHDNEIVVEYRNTIDNLCSLVEAMEIVADDEASGDFIKWYYIKGDGNEYNLSLNYSKFDVSDYLYSNLFNDLKTAILTSATIRVNNEFEYFLDRTGLNKIDKDRIITSTISSPFDYENQLVFFSYHSDKNELNSLNELSNLIIELSITYRKGTLVLFTSIEAMKRVYDKINSILSSNGIEVLIQTKRISKEVLLDRFRRNKGSVLLGTDIFWEGIDIVGDSLQILIIQKLPFDVPSDPLVEAYCEKLEKDGKDYFIDYYIPEAIIKFRQGFGRLIRSKSDIGIVINFDNRIDTKYYGRFFKDALPVKVVKVRGIGATLELSGRFFSSRE